MSETPPSINASSLGLLNVPITRVAAAVSIISVEAPEANGTLEGGSHDTAACVPFGHGLPMRR